VDLLHKNPESFLIEALENELRAIGGELHDTVCQTLAGTGMLIESILRAVESGKPMPLQRIVLLKKSIETTIDQTRALSRKYNPVEVRGPGLMSALEGLARLAPGTGEFKCEKPVFVSDERAALALYRIAQESCRVEDNRNASRILIVLSEENGFLRLEVRRNGKLSTANSLSTELMRVRARQLGGEVVIRAAAEGVTVSCRIPSRKE
jgi:signal transduction histidine kinase